MAELTINADDVRNALNEFAASYEPGNAERVEVGRVTTASDGIARVEGLPSVMANELLRFEDGTLGLAQNLDVREIGVIILGDFTGIEEGQEVHRTGEILSVPVGDAFLAGISSDSRAKVLAELEPKLAAASLPLAQELFSVLAIVDSSAALRRALTDQSRQGAEKAALIGSLVRGKVSAEAAQIVDSLANERWANARDFGDALETVATTVAVAVAENQGPGAAGLEQLENDLFSFNKTVESDHQVQRALSEPQASAEAKRKLALALVPGAGQAAQLLIGQAVSEPRGARPAKLVEQFATLAAARQERWIATVTVGQPLSETQESRLAAGLNNLYGRELKVNISVDPALIGGVRVRVGDEVVDASVLTRLGELRRQLAG